MGYFLRAGQYYALDAGSDCATDQAVKPMVVMSVGTELPFVDGTATARGFDAELGDKMFGEQLMGDRVTSEEG